MNGMTALEYVTVAGSVLGGVAVFGLLFIRLQFAPGPIVARCRLCDTSLPAARTRKRGRHRARRRASTMAVVGARVAALELTRAVAAATEYSAVRALRQDRAELPPAPLPAAARYTGYELLAGLGAARVPAMRLPQLDHRSYRDTWVAPSGEWAPVQLAALAQGSRLVECATAVSE